MWRCGDLECCGIGAGEMWAMVKRTGIILTNATEKCGKTLCHLFSKCDSHVIAHMKCFCIQSCLYVITLLASARVLHVKPFCQHMTDEQIWDLRCRPI